MGGQLISSSSLNDSERKEATIVKLNPDSFSARLLLNGIDKLVFTLLLMLILATWTHYQREYERAQVRAEEVNSIKTQRPIKLVEESSNLIRQCMLFMQRVPGLSLRNFPEEDKEQFASLLLDLTLNIELIKSYSRDRPETTCAAEELQKTVEAVDEALLKKPAIGFEELKRHRDNLYKQFVELSDSMIDETTEAISVSGDGEIDRSCLSIYEN